MQVPFSLKSSQQVFNVDTSDDIQAGQRPITVIKDKHNSLLIIKLHLGTVAGGTITGGVESSFGFNKTFNFFAEADLFTTVPAFVLLHYCLCFL